MSSGIGELLKYGEALISLDIVPGFDYAKLNEELQKIFKENTNKKIKNSLGKLLPAALVPVILKKSKINFEKFCNSVTRDERLDLIKIMKDLRMKASGLLGAKKAIVTSGGVLPREIDFKTMRSRLYPNLFLAGDVLDIDRPSGGYSLQICWSTGYVAGNSAG